MDGISIHSQKHAYNQIDFTIRMLNILLHSWLFGRLASPLSTKISYIGDKVLGGDLVPPG